MKNFLVFAETKDTDISCTKVYYYRDVAIKQARLMKRDVNVPVVVYDRFSRKEIWRSK